MSASCGHHAKFDGVSDSFKRRLWVVIVLNAAMFLLEMSAGYRADSHALKADALDFLADALTYGLSMAVIGSSIASRTNAALFKAMTLLFVGIWVFGTTLYSFLSNNVPVAHIMGWVGVLALAVNCLSVLLLVNYKDGDANVRSVWLCSRNDAIGNVAVLFAAFGVWGTSSAWPDLIVAIIMAALFLSSAFQIIRQALQEKRESTIAHQSH